MSAIKAVTKNGGKVNTQDVTITPQKVQPVKLEQRFEGIYAVDRVVLNKTIRQQLLHPFGRLLNLNL